MIIQAFFGEAQTGLGYQFYDESGALLGTRVTTGIVSLPEAGGYAAEVVLPEGTVGVFWSSDTSQASEDLAGCTPAESTSGGTGETSEGSLLDAGFGTLAQLKGRVFPSIMESYDSEGEWDDDLRQIGLGVAGEFNRHCNRIFERGVDAVYDGEGGGRSIVLDRYPVESVTSVTLTSGGGDSVVEVDQLAKPSGIVYTVGSLGSYRDRVTVIYTGGYWLGSTRTLSQVVVADVPALATQVTVTTPAGFLAGHAVAVSIERLTGDGQLVVANYDTTGTDVVVTFTSAPADDDRFRVSVRFEITPSTSAPDGAKALPVEVFNAWALQCQHEIEQAGVLRGAGVNPADKSGLTGLTLLHAVERILKPYKRFI